MYRPKNDHIKDEDIIQLNSNGKSWKEIASILCTTYPTIRGRAKRLKLKSPHCPIPPSADFYARSINPRAYLFLDDPIWLSTQYSLHGTRTIADDLGCGKKAVLCALRRHNIQVGKSGTNRDVDGLALRGFLRFAPKEAIGKLDNIEWLREHYITRNMSARQIGTMLGVSIKCVQNWARRHSLCKTHAKKLSAIKRGFGRWTMSSKMGKIWCQSGWESQTVEYLDTAIRVISFVKDRPIVPYYFDGKSCKYFPDFMVTLDDGIILVIEVKSNRFLYHRKVVAKFSALTAYCEVHDYIPIMVSGSNKPDLSVLDGFVR